MRDDPKVAAAVRFLDDHGAATIDHPGGTLLAHLRRTHDRLFIWNAPDWLRLAGLCHAAYGTDGFATALIDHDEAGRDELAGIIGFAAERVVYFYASCDRDYLYPQLGADQPV